MIKRPISLSLGVLEQFALIICSFAINFSSAFAQIAPLVNVSKITAGLSHTCVVTTTGVAKCWGDNSAGQLGDNSTVDRMTPVNVSGLTSGVVDIAAGMFHTCATTTAGGVKCWGRNTYGQLGDNTTINRLTPVDVIGLTSGVIKIATGGSHTCALTSGGGVKCWGSNGLGSLGDSTTTQRLTAVDVAGLASGVAAITTGSNHSCARMTSGGVKCWGWNGKGQLGDATTTLRSTPVDLTGFASGITALSAGNEYTCAVDTAGAVKCWGWNYNGQIGDNSVTTRLAPVNVMVLSAGMATVAAGEGSHTCGITAAGAAKCWGNNDSGQLGDNSTVRRLTPVSVLGISSALTSIVNGANHSCAVTVEGGVKCWGYNRGGLGVTSGVMSLSPVDVVTSQAVLSVSGAPTGAEAVTSNVGYGQAAIKFSAPASNGGNPISSYTVTASPGGATISGPTSPLFIGGLTYGTTYTFSVTATNEIGTSAPSSPTIPILIAAPNAPLAAKPGFQRLRVLLVPFHFPEGQPSFPISQVQAQLMGDHAYSARALWQRNSYGAFSLDVDIKPWMALRNGKTYHQGRDALRDEALAMIAENYSLGGYDAVAVMLTPLDYGYPGMATYQRPGLPIGTSGATLPVLVFSGNGFSNGVGTAVMAHEIGHVLGFMHTSWISCGSGTGGAGWIRSVPPALSDPYYDDGGCGDTGQATLFTYAFGDPMGIYTGQTHAINMLNAGWLDPDQVQVANLGTNIYLDALDSASSGLKAVTVNLGQTPDGRSARYTVDYRADPVLNPDTRQMEDGSYIVANRVTVSLDPPGLWDPGNKKPADTTHLSFVALNTSKQYEMNLSVGQAFWDQYRGIRIQRGVDRTQSGTKQAQVTLDRSKLVVLPEIYGQLTPGQTQQFTVRNDSANNVVVNSTALKGRHVGQFQLSQDGCSKLTLAPAASCQVSVLFVGGASITDSNAAQAYLQWDTTDTLRPQATVGLQGVPNQSVTLEKGWNLLGNPVNQPMPVATTFGNTSQVSTVWKWVTTGSTPGTTYPTWAFYSPTLSDGGRAYASTKGYEFLTTINAGDGFWVNANTTFTAQLPVGAAVPSTAFQNMSSGWHLIATGDTSTPSVFNTALSLTPPAAGSVPQNITTLWSWDNVTSKWYFYAPSLESQGGTALADYITGKGYLDFTSARKTIGSGTGFWVNKP